MTDITFRQQLVIHSKDIAYSASLDESLPPCHPTDTAAETPYGRTLFKNSRGSRLSFQSESRTYNRRVSFDNTTAMPEKQHVVLRQTTDGFERTRRSRVYLVPVNMDVGALDGIKFALMDLAEESDEIIAVGIYSQEDDITAQYKADELMRKLMEYHQGDKISMTVEVFGGKSARDVLEEMVDIYEPSMVIVASQRRPNKASHEFSGTGIFKNALKRCVTPIIFVPTEAYIRRASTGDLHTSRRSSSQDDQRISARRSASDPQVKVPARVSQSRPTSLRFLMKMLEVFKRAR
ncbi:hypothetical protein BJV82DRAFT_586408 [Fennellomyces sp. T-0311]|nr:hypothetical protein BJV82DRAFT_586408 [Fennellomyces sp. T-0311]